MAPLFWTSLIVVLGTTCGSHPFLVGGQTDNVGVQQASEDSAIFSRRADFDDLDLDLDLTAEESAIVPHSDDQPEARYRNPFPYAFNGGKPFSLLKDPVTGQIDFEKAPPLKAVNFTDQYEDVDDSQDQESGKEVEAYLSRKNTNGKNGIAVGPNEINPYSPSFHDFLNLPVQYSSDKYGRDKYPLISNSYANTKVQSGSNLYSTYNHRPYHESSTRSSVNNVVTRRAYTTQPTTTTTEPTTTKATTTTAKPTTTTAKPTTTTTKPTTTTTKPRTTTTRPTTTTRKITTTTRRTTTTTETPTTKKITTTSTSPEPPITTWKPATKVPSRFEEYDDILPIEKLQTPKYDNDQHGPNDVASHSVKPPVVDEYSYEEYEDEDHYPINTPPKDESTETAEVHPTLSTISVTPEINTKTPENKQPVTSMPLDNENVMKDSPYENVVEGHRPGFGNTIISGPGHVHFPNSLPGRPIGMLPESTSNIVVPPDQDTVSFVLGNRQNVEGTYYTHTSAGENTYSGVIGEGSFRPVISGQSLGSHATMGHPSVSVVEQDFANQPQWYKPRPPVSVSNPPIRNSMNYNPQISNSQPPLHSSLQSSLQSSLLNSQPSLSNSQSNSQFSNYPQLPNSALSKPLFNSPPNSASNSASGPFSNPSNGQLSHSSVSNGPMSNSPLPNGPVSSFSIPSSPVFSSPVSNSSSQGANNQITNEVDVRPRPPSGTTNEGVQQFAEEDKKEDDYKKGYVVFPGPSKNQESQHPVEEHVVIINEADGTIQEFTTSTTTSAPVDTDQESKFPLPSEDLTPPTERPRPSGQRPPYYFHYQQLPTTRPDNSRPSRLPLPPRTKPDPVIFKRRPVTPDTKLPNILPQFRPNAKTSYGHRGSETIGTIPAQVYHSRPRPPPSFSRRPSSRPSYQDIPTSFLQRLSPPPPSSRPMHHTHKITNAPKEDSVIQNSDQIVKRIRQPPANLQGNLQVRDNERTQPNHFPVTLGQKQKSRPDDEITDRFPSEPPQIPPRLLFPRHRTDDNVPRIATLQMIQQRGGLDESVVKSNLPPPLRSDENQTDTNRRKDEFQDSEEAPNEPPVYVVYPVNTAVNIGQDDSREKDESVVVGTHGPHRPLPPETLLQDDESDQNPQASPIVSMPVKHYDSVIASNYPYPLEAPDPPSLTGPIHETPLLIPSDQKQHEEDEDLPSDDRDSSVNIIPYLQDYVPYPPKKNSAISTTLHRLPPNPQSSSTPIAYVFTPTAQPMIHRSDIGPIDEISRYDHFEEKPVLLPSQQPSSSSSSAPSPQTFMAPFIASANAEAPAKNGWNVVVVETNDRSSSSDENNKDALTAEDTQTERSEFDPDNFKPQLFGGFKPIYEFPTQNQADREIKDMPRSLS